MAEYEQNSNDFNIYIFRYKIDKLKKEPYIILIDSLKKLKNHTYIEKWAYELAKLYYKAEMEKECIRECSDLILWFGEGSYVEKAKILKAYYSGEVDKDEIIESLKNRAMKTSEATDTQSQEDEQDTDEDKALSEEDKVLDEESPDMGEDNDLSTVHETIEDEIEDAVSNIMKARPGLRRASRECREGCREFMTTGQSEIYKPTEEEAGTDMDIYKFIKTENKNEDLEKLEKLAENQGRYISDIRKLSSCGIDSKAIGKMPGTNYE